MKMNMIKKEEKREEAFFLPKRIPDWGHGWSLKPHTRTCEETLQNRFFGTVFEFGDVFCFTDFLSGFLFRVRGRVRVKVGVGGGFRVRVRVRASVRAR